MTNYPNGFKWGYPPHSGGVSLDLVVMFMLKLGDVRWASLNSQGPEDLPPRRTSLLLRQQWLLPRTSLPATFTIRNKPIYGELLPLESECTFPLLCTESAVH